VKIAAENAAKKINLKNDFRIPGLFSKSSPSNEEFTFARLRVDGQFNPFSLEIFIFLGDQCAKLQVHQEAP